MNSQKLGGIEIKSMMTKTELLKELTSEERAVVADGTYYLVTFDSGHEDSFRAIVTQHWGTFATDGDIGFELIPSNVVLHVEDFPKEMKICIYPVTKKRTTSARQHKVKEHKRKTVHGTVTVKAHQRVKQN